jgi:hypothetical protein
MAEEKIRSKDGLDPLVESSHQSNGELGDIRRGPSGRVTDGGERLPRCDPQPYRQRVVIRLDPYDREPPSESGIKGRHAAVAAVHGRNYPQRRGEVERFGHRGPSARCEFGCYFNRESRVWPVDCRTCLTDAVISAFFLVEEGEGVSEDRGGITAVEFVYEQQSRSRSFARPVSERQKGTWSRLKLDA